MKQATLLSAVLMAVGVAGAANVPPGLTGLWRFQDSTDKLQATVGWDLANSVVANAGWLPGPWTMLGVTAHAGLYADGGIIMDRSFDYLAVNPGFSANGGGDYVNEYTILWDVNPDPGLNSLYQTAYGGNANDGDLWIIATNRPVSTVGVDVVGFSTNTFDGTSWHRIVLSVKNGSFFRVYVDGTNYLDGAGQPIDGRFSLYPDRFNLFADNNWQDAWIRCGLVATWNRALSSEEIAAMGGWTNGSSTPTPLMFDETPTFLSVSPANGLTNGAPEIAYHALILDPAHVLPTDSVQLQLDGVVAALEVSDSGAMLAVRLGGGLFPGGTMHTYRLTGSAGGGGFSYTNEATLHIQDYTSYEWRFTAGDLSAALGNGTMNYVAGPAGTTFGTTDGSGVPHIDGVSTKYMHVPAFSLDSDGYHLEFTDSGPNVGAEAYINRYTLLMDVMVPSPWPLDYLVPFFNTDPYNLNDADFYLYGDGSIGIGFTGYSAPGAMTSNAWCRLAYVADLHANTLSYYVNGTNVKTGAANGVGGRWALYSNQDPGPDLLLFNEGDTGGIYTHDLYVSSVAFTDRALSASEVAALGAPKATGILVPGITTRPTLTMQPAGGGIQVSWPSGYVGYALMQTESVTAASWTPVAGITNNAVTLTPSGSTTFYRLVQ